MVEAQCCQLEVFFYHSGSNPDFKLFFFSASLIFLITKFVVSFQQSYRRIGRRLFRRGMPLRVNFNSFTSSGRPCSWGKWPLPVVDSCTNVFWFRIGTRRRSCSSCRWLWLGGSLKTKKGRSSALDSFRLGPPAAAEAPLLVLRQDILVELSATESGHSCTAVEGSDHYPQQHGHLLLVWLPTSTRRSCPRLWPPIYPAIFQSTTDSTGHQS